MDEIAEMEERLELALELETLFNHAYESNGGVGFTDHEFWRQSSEIADSLWRRDYGWIEHSLRRGSPCAFPTLEILSAGTGRETKKAGEKKISTGGKVGGRMRKRNHVVPVRLNAKELRHLDGQVAKSGLSREEFLRSLILGAQLQTKPCEHHAELLRKIAGLCNNANQLAHVANGTGMAGEASVQEMLRISKETWRLVKEEW